MLGLQTKYLFLEQRRVLRGEVVNTFGFRLKVIKMCAGCPKGGAPVEPELPWSPRNLAGARLLTSEEDSWPTGLKTGRSTAGRKPSPGQGPLGGV